MSYVSPRLSSHLSVEWPGIGGGPVPGVPQRAAHALDYSPLRNAILS